LILAPFGVDLMKLVIASPSPYARKARVALIEKGIDHEVVMDVPWAPDTVAPASNPLGKIPILLLDDGEVIHDSAVIVQYLEAVYPEPPLLPADPMKRLEHRKIEVLADGVCDAVVLIALEGNREPELRSIDWVTRQKAKVVAGLARLSALLGEKTWFIDAEIGIADIAAACALGYLGVRAGDLGWRDKHPGLSAFSERMEARPSFQISVPYAQPIPRFR
jgi:glutathione S-transferase